VIDTHCHLTFPEFADDVETVIAEGLDLGVSGFITVSTTTSDAQHALQLATTHDRIWSTSGVHPLYSNEGPHDWDALVTAARSTRCVAWGELGLDNHYNKPPKHIQREVLDRQLEIIASSAREDLDKPVVLHCREAFDELIPILQSHPIDPQRFVFHCFTAGPDEARACLDLGAMISFTGVVTFPNASEVAAAASLVPDDRIMVETDAPFLSPVPHRGERPCKPAWVAHTARFLADLRDRPFDEFHDLVNRNTARFFSIDAR